MAGSPRVIIVSLFGLLEIIQVIDALDSRSGRQLLTIDLPRWELELKKYKNVTSYSASRNFFS